MLESKSFNLIQPKPKDGWAGFQAWTRKWNRVFATIFCVLSFMLLFAIVVVNVIETEREIIEEQNKPPNNLKSPDMIIEISGMISPKTGGCSIENRIITCQSMSLDDIDEALNSLIKGYTKFALHLINIQFLNGTFHKDWLKPTTTLSISKFYLTDSPSLQIIENEIFDSRSFRETTCLTISNVSIEEFSDHTLKGLFGLEILELQNLPRLKVINSGFLAPVKPLKSILVKNVPMLNDPINITGVQPMTFLETIDFKYNYFENVLGDSTFKNLPALRNLYLRGNKIKSLSSKVFDGISKTVKLIDLTRNYLQTLPEGIFYSIRSSSFRIRLSRNPWTCDCDLVELKGYMMNPSTRNWFEDELKCTRPIQFYNQPVTETSFCPEKTTTTSTTFEPGEPMTTTMEPIEEFTTIGYIADPIECVICAQNQYQEINCTHQENEEIFHQYYESDQQIAIRRQTLNFRVEQVDETTVEIIVKNPNNINFVVFWFSESERDKKHGPSYVTNEKLCAECTLFHENHFKIKSLTSNSLYIFCLMKYTTIEISPFDCLPFKTDNLKDLFWLHRHDKTIAYSVSIISLLFCSFLGAFIMYCIIRKTPTLLKGSDRVIIVKDKEVIVMPNGHKKLSNSSSTSVSTTVSSVQSRPLPLDQSAYLTPIPSHTRSRYRKVHQRRSSDSSLESIRSYISTTGPIPRNLTCYSDFQGRCFTDLKDVPNTPPPLPQRRSLDIENAVDYATVSKSPDANIYTPFDYGTTIAANNGRAKQEA
uniref:CSON011750 protein n=1 Tax=Culicoides sonorensis TaxID=179676 RepID=A0A336KML0_CULSO